MNTPLNRNLQLMVETDLLRQALTHYADEETWDDDDKVYLPGFDAETIAAAALRGDVEEVLSKLAAWQHSQAIEAAIDAIPLPPWLPDQTPGQWTDRVLRPGTYPEHRNRQCSIGYHNECSDPDGERCKCPCHRIRRGELPAEVPQP